ncbi:MAG: RraA family protein [Luteitalea sp.]|nr:RraA family protein [Luteitalea sp.]
MANGAASGAESIVIRDDEPAFFKHAASALYAGVVSDILDELGFRHQAVDPALGLRPLRPEQVVVGRARTLVNDFDSRVENPYELAIEAMDGIQPGEVLVAGGRTLVPTGIFGELSATRVWAKQGTGAVINGFTRDGRKLMQMGFPVFCRGTSPIDTAGRVRVVDFNVALQLGERTVYPGQIIFADLDGLLLIPREAEAEVMERALERARVETDIRNELKSGASLEAVWQKYRVL